MKFKVGDSVIVTAGKDKGVKGTIARTFARKGTVVVEGANKYVKHVKPYAGRSGEKVLVERALPTAKIAIVNEKGQPDRIGYKLVGTGKNVEKVRIFKKTGTEITGEAKKEVKSKK